MILNSCPVARYVIRRYEIAVRARCVEPWRCQVDDEVGVRFLQRRHTKVQPWLRRDPYCTSGSTGHLRHPQLPFWEDMPKLNGVAYEHEHRIQEKAILQNLLVEQT